MMSEGGKGQGGSLIQSGSLCLAKEVKKRSPTWALLPTFTFPRDGRAGVRQ